MSLLVGCPYQGDAASQGKGGSCVESYQKTRHIGTFRIPWTGGNPDGTNLGQVGLFRDGLQKLGQSGRVVEHRITLAQTKVALLDRQKLLAITNNLPGCCVKNRQRGCVVACIKP